jgi:S-layer homology domain/Glucodextranase, domain B
MNSPDKNMVQNSRLTRASLRLAETILILSVVVLASFVLCVPHSFALTADPMDLSTGARSMGMGNAYVGVAEDSETVFVNPAGLGAISSLKLGSMYTSLLDDVNYTVISGVYPMDNNTGTLGAGIINQAVSGIPLFSNTGTAEGNGTYGDNVFFISHGFDLGKKGLSTSNLYGGYTLKYFMKSASGQDTDNMTGTGFAADLGLLYKPSGSVSYGLTLQNILAGTMNYADGSEDDIDSAMKIGTNITLLGDAIGGNAIYQNDSKVDMALEYDIGLRGKVPATIHMGFEYKPQMGVNFIDKILTLRAGVNQISSPSGNISDMTLGVGINVQGVEFNYAYSPMYEDIPGTSTQYFSLSYVGVPAPVKPIEEMKPLISKAPAPKPMPLIAQVSPDDKLVTNATSILVQGRVSTPSTISKLEINNMVANVSDVGGFEMSVPISTMGKHLIVVRATDTTGKTEERQIRVVKMAQFTDVPTNHWAVTPIQQLATAGLIEGYPTGAFQPERALSRAELATLLVKSKGIDSGPVAGKIFKDVPVSHWAAKSIKDAVAMGLVTGYPDRTFKPNNKISRTEGVVVLARFGELQQQNMLTANIYPDVSTRSWASPFIAAAKTAGLLDYIGNNNFEPRRVLTRAEAVEMLAKTTYVRAKLDNLMDWTVGFVPETAKTAVAAVPITGQPVANVVGLPVPGQGASVMPSGAEFSDIPDNFWASNSVKYIAAAGIMKGYPDGTFKPNKIVSRADLASILVKARRIPVKQVVATQYSDVSKQNPAAPYIKAAVSTGYLTGRKGSKFEPNKGASRAEAVAALVKFDKMEVPTGLREGPFSDMKARDWSSKYVAAAKDAGMLEFLQGDNFEANKSITRAELAEMIAKTSFGQAKIDQVKSASLNQ